MDDEDKIKPGDIVNVHFERTYCEWGVTVLYMPVATGDSWILRRPGDRSLVYVQTFSKIEKVTP